VSHLIGANPLHLGEDMLNLMPSLPTFLFAPLFYCFTLYFVFYLHLSLLWPKIQGSKLPNYSIQFLQGSEEEKYSTRICYGPHKKFSNLQNSHQITNSHHECSSQSITFLHVIASLDPTFNCINFFFVPKTTICTLP